jgi:hypothetical protein
VTAYGLFGSTEPLWFVIGVVGFLAVFALAGGLLTLLWWVVRNLPTPYVWVLSSAILTLANLALVALSVPVGIVIVGLGSLASASLVGAGLASLLRNGWRRLPTAQRVVAIAGLALGLASIGVGGIWLLDAGTPLPDPANAAAVDVAPIRPLDMPDPSQPGPYAVRTLFYGSGDDQRRPEYGANVDLVTPTVDGSALVDRWSKLRTAYWGFGPEALPLNGRVWYPEATQETDSAATNRFPLVLILHGQHPMEDFSDAGYAYLGELLASRGFTVVSVDENFLNLSPLVDALMFRSLVEVDDLRGWLLLEHLRVWRDWNEDPDTVFHQTVDMDHVALIGHSRGGQAVAVAAAFNDLPYYPDDASLSFDYGFGIRSVAAFAPVDGGYTPAEQQIVLENINYLVLHGSHDMDVFTFQGDRQYSRVDFSDGGDWFKSALYIYGANHGQFNTSWGRKDLFEPVMRIFNLEQLMPGAQQRQLAKVAISAFLEDTLRGQTGYRGLFQDLRRGQDWLPDTIYLSQYQDSATTMVCTYEEDIDLTSTTLAGGGLLGEHLTIWREQPAKAKWEDLGDQTVTLGWDAAATADTGMYTIQLPKKVLQLSRETVLVFALADAKEDPTPKTPKEEVAKPAPIDLTVEVIDAAGEVAQLPLSHVAALRPQLEAQLGKAAFMSPFPASDTVLQSFEFPLADFAAANPALDPADLTEVRFIFDRTEAGVIVLDNLGFRD